MRALVAVKTIPEFQSATSPFQGCNLPFKLRNFLSSLFNFRERWDRVLNQQPHAHKNCRLHQQSQSHKLPTQAVCGLCVPLSCAMRSLVCLLKFLP